MSMDTRAFEEILSSSTSDFRHVMGPDLFRRTEPFYDWQSRRRALGLWPHETSTDAEMGAERVSCLNTSMDKTSLDFASDDCLSLSSHPHVVAAARQAIAEFGVHSTGARRQSGWTELVLQLESELGGFLQTEHVLVFPTPWSASAGVFHGLIRPQDHIVMDALSHAPRHEEAWTASRNIYLYPHLEVETVRRILARIRSRDTANAILVVTDGIFSDDSGAPDLNRLQEAAREYGAFLMVDVANDLGALGPDGRGHLGFQEMIGRIDILTGSFSKAFASNGGFVATRSPAARQYLKWFGGMGAVSSALCPSQAAVVLACLRIIRSEEGIQRREALMRNVCELRAELAKRGLPSLGGPSPIVPVVVGAEDVARIANGILAALGVCVSLGEFPKVAKGQARFALHVTASHSRSEIQQVADALRQAIDEAVVIRARFAAGVTKTAASG